MTETANAVTICSNALLSLGAQPISSFDEAGGAAQLDRAIAGLHPQVRKAVLRSHPWNCAIRRVQPPLTPRRRSSAMPTLPAPRRLAAHPGGRQPGKE
ncbi:hypothetical protein SNK04_014161 [Fusarium graminearum]